MYSVTIKYLWIFANCSRQHNTDELGGLGKAKAPLQKRYNGDKAFADSRSI